MAEQKIELRRIRDFGENISDTFVFIRQNFKPLMAAFLGIAGVFMLSSAIVSGVYRSRMGNIFKEIFLQSTNTSIRSFDLFGGTYVLLLLLMLLNFTAMKVTIIAYMKVYDEKGGEIPAMNEVWLVFKRYFFTVLVFSIPLFVLNTLGYLFCIAPGIWLWVVLVPFEMLIMVEDRSFSDSFSRCFSLTAKNFWMSLGIYFVGYLIYYVSSSFIGIVVGVIGGAIGYLTTKDIAGTIGIFTSILTVFSYVFYIIYLVAATLNYYNLTERYEGTGMLKKLDTFGDRASDSIHPEEQY